MTRLVLINGAPGSGKTTLARRLAQDRSLDLALDIDALRSWLGRGDRDPVAAGRQARRVALAVVATQLESGHDVFVGQFLGRVGFIRRLEEAATAQGASFVEVILNADQTALGRRLDGRGSGGAIVDRAELPGYVQAIADIVRLRPAAVVVDASGGPEETADAVRRVLASSATC